MCVGDTKAFLGRFGDEHSKSVHDEEDDYDHPRLGLGASNDPPPAPVNIGMTGDEAYQRRLAMSAGFKRSSPPPPTPPTAVPSFTPSSFKPDVPIDLASGLNDEAEEDDIPGISAAPRSAPALATQAESSEEAYRNRLAMFQQTHAVPVRSPTPEQPSLAYNPFAPTAFVPPPSAAGLPVAGSVLSDEKVKSSREAAAAIAARLAALAPPATAADSSDSAIATSIDPTKSQPAAANK